MMAKYIVVGLNGMDCPAHRDHQCAVLAHGPFPTMNAAREYVATLPARFRLHIMTLYPPANEPEDRTGN